MGNIGSSGSASRRRRRRGSRRNQHQQNHPPPAAAAAAPHQPEVSTNRYVVTTAGAPNPGQYYHYQGYYPPPPAAMPVPLPAPYDHHHHNLHHLRGGGGGGHAEAAGQANWVAGRYPPAAVAGACGPGAVAPPYVEHQKAVTIRNDVNLKKESLRIEADENNPGSFLVSFTFDATIDGSITIIFFAKEGDECNLTPTKKNHVAPVTVHFQQGLGQKFVQPSGTGIDLSMFDEMELLNVGDMDVYPLAVKAEASLVALNGSEGDPPGAGITNSQITLAVFEKDRGEFRSRVVKQILWVNGMRYELQEIYGIGNSVEGDLDGNDPGKECVICLSEPRDTTVLPCRHMCMCSECAKVLRFQTNRCPICRQPVERLLEIRVNNGPDE